MVFDLVITIKRKTGVTGINGIATEYLVDGLIDPWCLNALEHDREDFFYPFETAVGKTCREFDGQTESMDGGNPTLGFERDHVSEGFTQLGSNLSRFDEKVV